MKNYVLLFVILVLLKSEIGYSQDVSVKIGIKDSVYSNILKENRKLVVSLPKDYDTSGKSYSVLYVLDGVEYNIIEARLIIRSLDIEMITVAISNTDRDRDMVPLSAESYKVKNPGAENFLAFIEKELITHIDKNYRTNGERTIKGRSLSGLFTMYAFLAKPELFNNYIGNCAGWFADMDTFFNALADKSFQNKDSYNGKKLFVANSLADPFDPNREIHYSVLGFSKRLKFELGDRMKFKYATYENAGHVPYPSFYDGLKYVMEKE